MQNNQATEQDRYDGGPGMDQTPPDNVVQQIPQNNQQQTQNHQGPIHLGGRVFQSMEELAKYTHDLEIEKAKLEQSNFKPKPIEDANTPSPSDLMFTDPKAYHELTVEEASQRALNQFETREAQRQLWNEFFDKHPDLKDQRELVEFQHSKMKKMNPNLPAREALDKVGVEVRSLISKVRGVPSGGKELSANPAVTVGASNGAPPAQQTAQKPSGDFISQVKQFQKRGK